MNRWRVIVSSFLGGLMPKLIDRAGQIFGRLRVVSRAGVDRNKKVIWRCMCLCGSIVDVPSGSLVTGNTTSCGCYLKERITKHGGWKKASYNTWRAMIRRCTVPTDKDYQRYGGAGVKVCAQWMDYSRFAADMGEPIGDETLDRIDVYGDYTPENCRWAGVQTQNRNVRVRSTSKTGVVGVSKTVSGTYMAKVTVKKRSFYSRCFTTIEEAASARKELERLHWGATP